MRKIFALIRASWLTATSYRLRSVLSFVSLIVSVIPLFFIARALQPLMADKIATQGEHYFAFLLVGMVTLSFLASAVSALPGAVGGGISTGTLEALLSTPTRVPTLLTGLVGYSFLWTGLRALAMLAAGWAFGAHYAIGRLLPALAILVLIVLAHLPFGIIAASFVLAFRAAGPLPALVIMGSSLLGGVYYPTHVIPSGIQQFSDVLPLTYGLRALRRTLLEGMPAGAVAADVGILLGFTVALMAISLYGFGLALRYARRAGTLAQY